MKRLKVTFNSPVVLGFIFISFGVLALGFLTGNLSNQLLFMTYRAPLWSPLTWLRGVTYIFGHADLAHMVGNMSYLLLLGPMLEEKYGSERLALIIAITAIITSVIHFVFFPSMALCGASGVVFAFILMTSFTGFSKGEIPLSFILVAAIFIGQQVYEGIFLRDSVSNLSHIVGGLVGSAAGYLLNRK
jgi:GlpG protein